MWRNIFNKQLHEEEKSQEALDLSKITSFYPTNGGIRGQAPLPKIKRGDVVIKKGTRLYRNLKKQLEE